METPSTTHDEPAPSLWRDTSLSTVIAGFVAVLIGYTSSAAIIFQAATAAGASTAQISSWLWALGIGMGVTSLGLSLRYRMPLLTAWSTPGAAFLATNLPGIPIEEAIGAFLFSALLITLCGVTGLFERLMRHIPSCRVPDDQMSYRSYPLLAARELLQQFIREQVHGHQAA